MPDLLIDLKSAKDDGRFADELKKYTNPTLLILDEWPLLKLSEDDAPNLLELINKRRKHSSTIFCSQFREEGWYNKLGGSDSPLSDAIMNRISYDSVPAFTAEQEKRIRIRIHPELILNEGFRPA
ncbi:MAG TPA: hypothetical protein DEP61_03640 [Lachnospiraceae bacterium]|nr:hypothetical protein [Lachnospiraceae bacterium]